MVGRAILAASLAFVGACGNSNGTCAGAPPSVALVEGYCTANEANRCYYAKPPMDGF